MKYSCPFETARTRMALLYFADLFDGFRWMQKCTGVDSSHSVKADVSTCTVTCLYVVFYIYCQKMCFKLQFY